MLHVRSHSSATAHTHSHTHVHSPHSHEVETEAVPHTHHGFHHEHHTPPSYNRAFSIGIALNIGFVVLEGGFGIWSNSMALLADAGHNMSDVLSLVLAWVASRLSQRYPWGRFTYGLGKSSILTALLNAILLMLACGGIAWEAVQRLSAPNAVSGSVMMFVAAVGIVINAATAWLFRQGNQDDANIRGAFLHMAADALVSVGVVLSGLCISLTNWFWLDPVISLIIVAVIVVGTWDLLNDALCLALDAAPRRINVVAVRTYFEGLREVKELEDLHIWAMSTTETALTAHIIVHELPATNGLLNRIQDDLHQRFDIDHTTIQIEVFEQDSSRSSE